MGGFADCGDPLLYRLERREGQVRIWGAHAARLVVAKFGPWRDGASEVEQAVLIAGFPIAAVYLAGLLIGELVERRRATKEKLES